MQYPELLAHGKFYHIYNRGINSCDLFREQANYDYFLELYDKHISPIADTFAWVLMPNHFHLLVQIKEKVTKYPTNPQGFNFDTIPNPQGFKNLEGLGGEGLGGEVFKNLEGLGGDTLDDGLKIHPLSTNPQGFNFDTIPNPQGFKNLEGLSGEGLGDEVFKNLEGLGGDKLYDDGLKIDPLSPNPQGFNFDSIPNPQGFKNLEGLSGEGLGDEVFKNLEGLGGDTLYDDGLRIHQPFSNLFNAYSKAFNKRYLRTGSLFEHPFKRKLIEDNDDLKTMIVYIHNNPVHHGFVSSAKDYPWSSYRTCFSSVPTYLQRDKVNSLFGNESDFEATHDTNINSNLKNNANSIKIVRTAADIQLVANLAHTIWNEHYVPIVGQDQVSYMLKTFQSAGAIEKQIKTENFEYYIINHLSEPSGYLAIKPSGNELFLSKFYVVKEKRGTGLGKHGLQFVIKRATELGIKTITLTVNKNNIGSIKAYEKMGFNTTGAVIADIGAGFVMDDFKMEYAI